MNIRELSIAALACVLSLAAHANDVTTEWASAKPPPVPPLNPVTLDGKTTALLVMDLQKPSCTMEVRPRCVPTIDVVAKLTQKARAAGAMIFYTFVGNTPNPSAAPDPRLAPKDGEWVEQRGPDKFLGSVLEQRLKDRGIKTVIVTGSSAQGVVIGSGAAQRGYKVIVPVDGMSSEDAYNEQYAAWHMYKGGPAIVTDQVTLTRGDMISFQWLLLLAPARSMPKSCFARRSSRCFPRCFRARLACLSPARA